MGSIVQKTDLKASIQSAFDSIKTATDKLIVKNKIDTFCEEFVPASDELATAIFCNAFEELGFPIRTAVASQRMTAIDCLPNRTKLFNHLYAALENNAGLIKAEGNGVFTRTVTECPDEDINEMLENLRDDRPGQSAELGLMGLTGPKYADFLSGKLDPLQVLFGTDEGRKSLSDFYGKSALFSVALQQFALFFEQVYRSWPKDAGTLRILEIGAGTGGTTFKIVPVLARMGIPVEYTMTDIGSSFGAAARAKIEQYPFLRFQVIDVEKEPPQELLGTQHIVLGSNVFHATRDLSVTMANAKKLLCADGCLLLHELTTPMLWLELVFGLVPGWWLFEDDRRHVLQNTEKWKVVLQSVGFQHVDWTDGERPETKIQAIIMAM